MATSARNINLSVDPAELNIVAIGSCESRAHSPHVTVGILRTKNDVINLIIQYRKRLCELLYIEIEECPSWGEV